MYAIITKEDRIIARDFRTRFDALNYRKVLSMPVDIISQNSKRFAKIEMKNKPNK